MRKWKWLDVPLTPATPGPGPSDGGGAGAGLALPFLFSPVWNPSGSRLPAHQKAWVGGRPLEGRGTKREAY